MNNETTAIEGLIICIMFIVIGMGIAGILVENWKGELCAEVGGESHASMCFEGNTKLELKFIKE